MICSTDYLINLKYELSIIHVKIDFWKKKKIRTICQYERSNLLKVKESERDILREKRKCKSRVLNPSEKKITLDLNDMYPYLPFNTEMNQDLDKTKKIRIQIRLYNVRDPDPYNRNIQ